MLDIPALNVFFLSLHEILPPSSADGHYVIMQQAKKPKVCSLKALVYFPVLFSYMPYFFYKVINFN